MMQLGLFLNNQLYIYLKVKNKVNFMESSKKIITKIEIQKRNKDRVNVYINEEFAFACSAELVYRYNIAKDKNVNVDYLNDIIKEDNYIKCKATALKTLEKTHKTQSQMSLKLLEKGYDEKTISKTIDFLKQYDFIDDEKFIEMYIKDKLRDNGRNRIKYDLIKKGISEEKINEKFSYINNTVEKQVAFKLAEKKYNLIIKNERDYRKIHKKIGDYLIRKGYNLDIVSGILNDVIKKGSYNLDKAEVEAKKPNEDKLYELAEKRYRIIMKSESDYKKIYKKFSDYLLRRGYSWESIKTVFNSIRGDV